MALQERHDGSILDATDLDCMLWRSRSAMRAAYQTLLRWSAYNGAPGAP